MSVYSISNTLQIAKRYKNPKRTYLLVNPLQAKHIPVSPSESLTMMTKLGELLRSKYPNSNLIIGFAETATAIGAAVANCFSESCIYLHTTREPVPNVDKWIEFSEEHSHAVEQKLFADTLQEWICQSETIIFVEDEISTGKTLINMIDKLKRIFPALATKKLVAASILNRVSPDNMQRMNDAGVVCEFLVQLPQTDYTELVAGFDVYPAEKRQALPQTMDCIETSIMQQVEPRKGTHIGDYAFSCSQVADTFITAYRDILKSSESVLVLGTEECMYPALILGKALELAFNNLSVRCHATTRSPIGICSTDGYPITSGFKIESFYSTTRDTYIYNLSHYDAVIVVTDELSSNIRNAMNSLAAALVPYSIPHMFCIQGGQYVWHI